MNNSIGIYIHIPFCVKKCFYCNFNSYESNDTLIDKYFLALKKEILSKVEILSEHTISSIYIGGGTPSFVDAKYIKEILTILRMFIQDISSVEITIEINPESASLDKMLIYRGNGVNRVSIGLQSTQDNILKLAGRQHTYSDFLNTLEYLKKVEIENVSTDLIYPLPNMELDSFKKDINKLIKLGEEYNIRQFSIYNLEVHENTKLSFLLKENYVSLPNEDTEYEIKEYLENSLSEAGYIQYEIANFAKDGYVSKHNLHYWNQGMYLGFGAGAASFFNGTRYTNISDLNKYISSIEEDLNIAEDVAFLDKLALMREYVMLKLRLANGVNIHMFKERFNVDLFDLFKEEFDELTENKLVLVENNNIFLTKRGKEVANLVWQKFI